MANFEGSNNGLVQAIKQLVLGVVDNTGGNDMGEITNQLKEASKQNGYTIALMSLICNDSNTQVRQLSCVLLRSNLNKKWKGLPESDKAILQQTLLNQLTKENEHIVLRSLMQVIGLLAKFEFSNSREWGDLMTFIETTCGNPDQNVVKAGAELLSAVCEAAYLHLSSNSRPILLLLNNIMSVPSITVDTSVAAVQAFKSLVPTLGSEHMDLVRQMIPKCVEATKLVLRQDESQVSDVMETFECLIESEVPFISPHVKDVVLFALEIAHEQELEEDTRVRALSLLQYVITCKKKAIMRHNLIEPILNVIWPIILESSDEDDDVAFIGDESDEESPFSASLHIIDELALQLSPETLFNSMLPLIQQVADSTSDQHQRGLLLTLACLTEGTSEFIKDNHMRPFVTLACKGAQSNNEKTRNAAMFAIGQFAEYLEPEICQYASEVMPLLFVALQQATTSVGMGQSRAYYALESFVENLEHDELRPYLDDLMNYLTTRMQTTQDNKEKALVISAMGALGNAAKDMLEPYMQTILGLLQTCLQQFNDELDQIHFQALDTLGVFVRTFGKNNESLAVDSFHLAINLMNRDSEDPDMRRSAYGLFSAVSTILEEKMEPYLIQIVPEMIKSIESEEGVMKDHHLISNGDDHGLAFLENDDENEDDEDDDYLFTVENNYMDAKTDACQALGDLAKYTKHAFLQYLQTSFETVIKQIEFPFIDVRKAAIGSCGQFVMTAYQLAGDLYPVFLKHTYEAFCKNIVEDSERVVVMGTLYTMKEMIQTCGVDLFPNRQHDLQILMKAVLQVLHQKSACQDADNEDIEMQQGEYDEMLIEYCGELFPVLAEKLGTDFLNIFKVCSQFFLKNMRPTASTSERSSAAGTLAETMIKFPVGSSNDLIADVMPKLLELTSDKQHEVRNNSIFAIGVFMQRCDDANKAQEHYKNVLNALSIALTKETKPYVIDNILGAVSRMIIAHAGFVPVKTVVQVILNHLPIREDQDENMPVYTCLAGVLHHDDIRGDEAIRNAIIQAMTQACGNEKVPLDCRQKIEESLRGL